MPGIDTRSIIRNRSAADATVEVLIDAIAEFGEATAEASGGRFRLDNARNAAFLRDYMRERVAMINRTTRKDLRKAVARAARGGENVEGAVRKVFARARDARARHIAATEIVRASSHGAEEAGRQTGLDLKTWTTQLDADVRHQHADMHGQTVGWNEKFTAPNGERALWPGGFASPELSINCRCFPAPTRPGVKAALGAGHAIQEAADDLRRPFEQQLEAAWKRVFDEQETLALAEVA